MLKSQSMVPWNTPEGAGGKAGGQKFQEDPNNLTSTSVARVLDLIGEGEIRGLVDGARSIFLDDTPLMSGNEFNFNGFRWAMVNGLPDQGFIPGFARAESPLDGFSPIETKSGVRHVRRIADLTVDAVKVTIGVQALNRLVDDGMRLTGASVSHQILVRSVADGEDAPFLNATVATITGKTTSPYQQDYRIELPGQGPWDIAVERTTQDPPDSKTQDNSSWQSIQLIYDNKFSYPFSALVGVEVNAKYFGSAAPRRSYEVYGLIIKVPSNYDPIARTYAGLWDGTFKWAWSNNPAWVFYDLVTNNRYGLGIPAVYVDKWGLYTIAQYCDELVPDGYGDEEPRFTFNGVLNRSTNAYQVLQDLASSFRGMVFWGAGMVTVGQDAPSDSLKVFTPANAVNGEFEYTSTSKKARHTVCVVSWNNPAMGYQPDYEVIEDRQGILKYGMKVMDMAAVGCTSRGQARRVGKWALAAEALETDSVRFRTGFDAQDLMPGHKILIADPAYAGIRMGGRVLDVDTDSVQLDAPFYFKTGEEYEISIMSESGEVISRDIGNAPGLSDVVQLVAPFGGEAGAQPMVGAIYAISEVGNVQPRPFRVLGVSEADKGMYEVFALEHIEEKYEIADSAADFDAVFDDVFDDLPNSAFCKPPSNLTLQVNMLQTPGGPKRTILADWVASPDKLLQGYMVSYRFEQENWVQLPLTTATSVEVTDPLPGIYEFRVMAVNTFGVPSKVISRALNTNELGDPRAKSLIENLRIADTDADYFNAPDAAFVWDARPISQPFGPAGQTFQDEFFDGFLVEVIDEQTDTVKRSAVVYEAKFAYTYQMNLEDEAGRVFRFRVSVRSKQKTSEGEALVSNHAEITAFNPSPTAALVTFQPGMGMVKMNFIPPQEPDYLGVIMWGSETSGFIPDDTNRIWYGGGNPVFPVDASKPYYVRYAFYDTFGLVEVDISDEAEVTGNLIDVSQITQDFRELLAGGEALLDRLIELEQDSEVLAEDLIGEYMRRVETHQIMEQLGYVDGIPMGSHVEQTKIELQEEDQTILGLVDLIAYRDEATQAMILRAATLEVEPGKTLLTSLTDMTAAIGDVSADLLEEKQLRVDADSAEAVARQALAVQLGDDIAAAVATEASARADGDSAEAQARQALAVQLDADLKAYADSAVSVVADDLGTVATKMDALGAYDADSGAFLINLATVKSLATGETMGSILQGIQTDADNASAAVVTESQARINGDDAISQQVTTVSNTVNGYSSTITTMQQAVNGMNAKYGVALNVNGYITGFIQNNNGSSGDFIVLADKFAIVTPGNSPVVPFSVVSGYANFANPVTVYKAGASGKLIMGPGFGASGDLVLWFGPSAYGPATANRNVVGSMSLCTDGSIIVPTASGGMEASVDNAGISGGRTGQGTATTNTVHVTVTGGSGNYAYYWNCSGGGTATAPNYHTTAVSAFVGLGQTKEGLLICTIVDSSSGKQIQVSVVYSVTEFS